MKAIASCCGSIDSGLMKLQNVVIAVFDGNLGVNAGLGIRSFQKNAMFLRSFLFFIKERNDLCVLFRSL